MKARPCALGAGSFFALQLVRFRDYKNYGVIRFEQLINRLGENV